MPNNFLLTSQPPPLRLTKMSDTGVKLEPPSGGRAPADSRAPGRHAEVPAGRARMPAFCSATPTATPSKVWSACSASRRRSSALPIAPASARRRARGRPQLPDGDASRLLAMAEAAQNLRGIGCRAPDTGEDALALAINAEQPADEA
uniref:DUF768 domain-containing protein n=1 Tax=Macrostomum lignano TaxID=282301 RepID=A0A1I8IW25_9PLAT